MVGIRQRTNRLARKLMLIVVLSSTLITVLATSFQLYGLYSRDIGAIDSRLNEIETIHLKSIANDVWVSDYDNLNNNIKGLLQLPDMLFVEITEEGRSKVKAGELRSDKVIQRSYALKYFYNGENREIGQMTVQFDLDNVYGRLIDQGIDILISNSIKTFLVSLLILFIFSRLVTRHLHELSDHVTALTTNNMNKKFVFSKKKVKENEADELDILADAFNKMQDNIREAIKLADVSLKKLAERESFYSSVLDMSPALICVKDIKGKFIFFNKAFEKKFDIKRNAIKDEIRNEIFESETAKQQDNNNSAVLNAKIALEFEETIVHDDIRDNYFSIRFPLHDDNNEIYAIGCVSSNINKIKNIQNELSKKSIEQEEILHSLIDGVITVKEDFKIEMVNFSAERLLGYRSKSLIGKDIDVLMKDADRKRFKAIRSMITPDDLSRFVGTSREFYAKKKDGVVIPIQLSINKLPDNDKGEKQFIGSFIDLSEIKEKELILRQSSKMEALGKLTGGIAHDYNNMLGVIMGYSELLEIKFPTEEKYARYIHEIQRACDRGANLTRKLLSFSSNKNADASSLDLSKVVHDSHDMLQKTLTVRITLKINTSNKVWPVLANLNGFEDSLLNICINSMHAMPDGGCITIDTDNVNITTSQEDDYGLAAGEYVQLSIADNGFGMPEEVKARIFDPFFTTKGEKGTGLGLSQVYGFMKRSDGIVNVSSEKGVGTQFDLYFPRYNENVKVIEEYKNTNEVKVSGNECVLVVEDEDALRELNMTILESNGYEVYAAANGIEAIELLKQHDFSLVLSDLLMPEMDGYALSAYLLEHYPRIKIQLLSGFSEQKFHDQLDEDLRSSMLLKPVRSDDLLKRIRGLLDDA